MLDHRTESRTQACIQLFHQAIGAALPTTQIHRLMFLLDVSHFADTGRSVTGRCWRVGEAGNPVPFPPLDLTGLKTVPKPNPIDQWELSRRMLNTVQDLADSAVAGASSRDISLGTLLSGLAYGETIPLECGVQAESEHGRIIIEIAAEQDAMRLASLRSKCTSWAVL